MSLRVLFAAGVACLVTASTAFAAGPYYGNTAVISQNGGINSAVTAQRGLDNVAVTTQNGGINSATIRQRGFSNGAGIGQAGAINSGSVYQSSPLPRMP